MFHTDGKLVDTMLKFPRWRVDVTVAGDLVKTLYETATTSKAAIAKAKHQMRGSVSNAGAFKFKAMRDDEDLAQALKSLHDVVDGKRDILTTSLSERATLRECGYVGTDRNGNAYVTKAGKNAVRAITAARS